VCAWAGDATSNAPLVNLSTGHPNWDKYRYRVFETIIPLRNVIWSKDAL
jgi:type IV pilus assembly protein PilW